MIVFPYSHMLGDATFILGWRFGGGNSLFSLVDCHGHGSFSCCMPLIDWSPFWYMCHGWLLPYMFGIMVLFLVYCSSCLESATSMFMYDGSSPLRGWIMMMWGSDMAFVWSTLVIIDGLLVTWYISSTWCYICLSVHGGVIFVCH